MHLRPFGCIKTPFGCITAELFSENPNQLKTGFQGKKLLTLPQEKQSTFWWFSDFSTAQNMSQVGGKILILTNV